MAICSNVAFIGLFLHTLTARIDAQGSCQPGTVPIATGGSSYRWPVPNPSLVAPVNINYSYPAINYPLQAEFTGTSIVMNFPAQYGGGFSLIPASGSSFATEQFVLKSMEIRKPALVQEGKTQALKHDLEAALIHEQVGGGYFANVVIPFDVSPWPDYDPLHPLVAGAQLPQRAGDVAKLLLEATAQPLYLTTMFQGATFQNFWSTLQSNCTGTTVNVRQFLRGTAQTIGWNTLKALQVSLGMAADFPPIVPPTVTWMVNSCNATGLCTTSTAEPLTTKYAEAQQMQSVYLMEFRERKELMDQYLGYLVNGSATYTPDQALAMAKSARQDLQTSLWELENIEQYVSELQTQVAESSGATWDAGAPSNAVVKVSLMAKSVTKIAAEAPQTGQSGPQANCNDLRLSPANIDTARVVDPGTISVELREPLKISRESFSLRPQVQVELLEGRVRISGYTSTSSEQSFGSILLAGAKQQISYIDVISPAGHAVNGRTGDVELQFVHVAQGNAPAIGIAMRLEIGEKENEWLSALLRRPLQNSSVISAVSLPDLHEFLRTGTTDKYFRYDGSLTAPPCSITQWYVVEEAGHVTHYQVEELRAMLNSNPSSTSLSSSVQRFTPNLVAMGTTRLASQVGSATALGLPARRKFARQRRRIGI